MWVPRFMFFLVAILATQAFGQVRVSIAPFEMSAALEADLARSRRVIIVAPGKPADFVVQGQAILNAPDLQVQVQVTDQRRGRPAGVLRLSGDLRDLPQLEALLADQLRRIVLPPAQAPRLALTASGPLQMARQPIDPWAPPAPDRTPYNRYYYQGFPPVYYGCYGYYGYYAYRPWWSWYPAYYW